MRLIPRMLRSVLLLAIVLSSLYVAPAVVAQRPTYLGCTIAQTRAIEDRVHVLMNQERQKVGLNPLIRVQAIDAIAQDWSAQMLATGDFEHRSRDSFDAVTPSGGGLGENIVYWGWYWYGDQFNQVCDVEYASQYAMSLWMGSEGHRNNILSPSYTHAGHGFASSDDRLYATMNLGWYDSDLSTVATTKLSSTEGPAGSVISVSGTGYPRGMRVNIYFGPTDRLVGYVTTDAYGSYMGRITVPNLPAGAYQVRVRINGAYLQSNFVYRIRVQPATLTLTPTTVGPAGIVSISGTNFQPGERVDLRWGSANGDIIGSVIASSNGSISGRVTVRATMSGTYRIVARGTSSSKAIGANVVVNGVSAHITVLPSVTGAGTVVGVTGQGFAPWETVNITWNTYTGRLLGSVRASADGKIAGRITIPADASGTYHVYARGQTSYVTVRQRVAVTSTQSRMAVEAPQINLSQSELTMGETTTLTGRGFQPGEDVTISAGKDAVLTTVPVDDFGRFEADITIPDPLAWADQEQQIRVTGAESKREAEAPFTITDWDRAEVKLAPAEGPGGTNTTVSASGFAPEERVTVNLESSDGRVLANGIADAQGNISIDVVIPDAPDGDMIDLVVAGADGMRIGKATFTVREPVIEIPDSTPVVTPDQGTPQPEVVEQPDVPATPTEETTEVSPATPTEVPTETPIETPTSEPTETPTEEATEIPTETPTEEATETPTETPTEEPTETPTETPTEEPAEIPTEIPTEEPTETPTETPTEPVISHSTEVPWEDLEGTPEANQ